MRISDWSSDVCSSDLLPFAKVLRLVQPVIDIELVDAVDPAIADGEGARVIDDDRPVDAAIYRATHGEHQGTDPYRQGHRLAFQIAPFAVEPVSCAAFVQFEAIDIDHVGPVDRVGPAQILVMAEEGEGAAGELRPGEMQIGRAQV